MHSCSAFFFFSAPFFSDMSVTMVALSNAQDYCGLISEEALRKNFILIYELLDEMMVRFYIPSSK